MDSQINLHVRVTKSYTPQCHTNWPRRPSLVLSNITKSHYKQEELSANHLTEGFQSKVMEIYCSIHNEWIKVVAVSTPWDENMRFESQLLKEAAAVERQYNHCAPTIKQGLVPRAIQRGQTNRDTSCVHQKGPKKQKLYYSNSVF